MTEPKKPKICFVASGGGHLRQLLQLAPLQTEYPYYFVTEKTSLGESLVQDHRTRFVPHFAFGQRETEGFIPFLWSGIKNALASTWYFFREWPSVVITSGAGAAFVTVAWARIFGRKIIYLESIARVTEISLFGKLAAKHAGLCIVQWPSMVDKLKGATYCSPLVVDDARDTNPRDGVLVTVGTVMPFDRMVHGVETLIREGKISGDVAAQIGDSTEKFEGMESFASCPFEELNTRMSKADVVICHGGSGSILGALKAGAHVVAMARLHKFGEHYDDHQQDITKAFADMKLISVASDGHDIERAITEARSRPRKTVNIDPSEYLVAIRAFIQKESKPMRSLHQLKHVRKILVKAKYLIYTKVWGMDIHPTCNFSLSAKFDRTYPKGMHIGAHTYVAFDAAILCHDMTRGLYLDTYIGENCFIGARSIVLPGVKIGNGCIVGAGSIVTKDVPDGCAVAGNPAQIIRKSIEVGHYGRLSTADETEKRLLGEAA